MKSKTIIITVHMRVCVVQSILCYLCLHLPMERPIRSKRDLLRSKRDLLTLAYRLPSSPRSPVWSSSNKALSPSLPLSPSLSPPSPPLNISIFGVVPSLHERGSWMRPWRLKKIKIQIQIIFAKQTWGETGRKTNDNSGTT